MSKLNENEIKQLKKWQGKIQNLKQAMRILQEDAENKDLVNIIYEKIDMYYEKIDKMVESE